MKIEVFIEKFAEQCDETDSSLITPETKFRELKEWSSLLGLSLMAMIDDEYDVQLKGDEIRKALTIRDLFQIVESKKA